MEIGRFLEALRAQTTSKETLRAYRQNLERFESFLSQKGLRVNQVTPSVITQFMSHLAQERSQRGLKTLAPATVSRRLSVISAYFDWIINDACEITRNPVVQVKRPKSTNVQHRDANDSDLAALAEGITDLRDRAIVLLFLYSGLRLSELARLEKASLSLRRKRLPGGHPSTFWNWRGGR